MKYRPLREGSRFASWLDATKGKSGVYVVRSALTHAVLYVGESHSGNLYKTITRHYWSWRDGFKPHYTIGIIPVEIAVRFVSKARAVDEQNRLIVRLRPRYNINVPRDEVPF